MKKEQQITLLDDLSRLSGCLYLSDLKQKYYFPAIQAVLKTFIPDAYPLSQWNDAVIYITGQTVSFSTIEEVLACLHAYFSDAQNSSVRP